MAKSSLEKFLTRLRVAVAVILLAIVIIALATYLATPPTPSQTPEVTPTIPTPTPEFTTVSPYLAEFRSRPENFVSYTKVLYVLVNDKSGRTVANLTYALQFTRINYTVRATLNCSLKAAPEVVNVSFGVASCWLITEGTTPVPLPYAVAFTPTHTLRNGENITIEPEAAGNRFEEDWTWAQFSCIATLNKIKVTFTDCHLFTYDEVIETINTGGDLFEFLHNNPVGTEERVFVSE